MGSSLKENRRERERKKSQTDAFLIKKKIERKRKRLKPHGFREIARRENKRRSRGL